MRYHRRMDRIDTEIVRRLLLEDANKLVEMAEQDFRQKIEQMCDEITARSCRIILLTGPSASGKTTTAKMIQRELTRRGSHVHRVALDNFYRPRNELPLWNDGYINYESIEGLDIPYYNQLIEQLKKTGKAEFPIFDFNTSTRSERTFPIALEDETHIIFEGIHALNPLLSEHFEDMSIFRVYVSVHSDFTDKDGQLLLPARQVRLIRRMLRDNSHRSSTPVNTLEMWGYVVRGEEEYIQPYRRNADFHLNSTHCYEPFVYYDDIMRELAGYQTDKTYGETIRTLVSQMETFIPLNKLYIPPTSLLREFI